MKIRKINITDIMAAINRNWDGRVPLDQCYRVVVDVSALTSDGMAERAARDLETYGVRCDNKSVIQVFYKVEKQGVQDA